MIDEVLQSSRERMQKAVQAGLEQFALVRTGRATPSLLQSLTVDYYGAPTPLPQLASVQNSDARSLVITPYDKSALKDIEQAIRDAPNLGANPTNDGTLIRFTLPELTAERRKDYVKLVRERAEDARIAVRGARRQGMDELEELKSEIGEDDVQRGEKELENITRKHVADIDQALARKESELLEV